MGMEGRGQCFSPSLPPFFPVAVHHQARDVAPSFNLMIDAVSRDLVYLSTTLEAAGEEDEFTVPEKAHRFVTLQAIARGGKGG